ASTPLTPSPYTTLFRSWRCRPRAGARTRGEASSDQDGPSAAGSRNHLTTILSDRSTCWSISQPARTKRSTSSWYFRTLAYSRTRSEEHTSELQSLAYLV